MGTAYAERGRNHATRVGLDLVGPRMNRMLDDLRSVVPGGPVLVHCWRGGMRSESVAWLLNFSAEFQARTLQGGYKAFRRWALKQFVLRRRVVVLGGMTGSGKTDVLHALAEHGEQVVDLEGLANHKGSAFGSIGLGMQPTQQQFENELAIALWNTDRERRLWVEDESRRIGRCMVPGDLWNQMREAACVVLERGREERRHRLVSEYGRSDLQRLIGSIRRIERRLGGERSLQAVEHVESGDLDSACGILLDYYDKTYEFGLARRTESLTRTVRVNGLDPKRVAAGLIEQADIEFARSTRLGSEPGPGRDRPS